MINLQTRELVLKWKKEGKKQQQIADLAGVSRTTVQNCKRNLHFLACISEITKTTAKYDVPDVVRSIKAKALEGSVRAQELFLRYTGDYVPTARNENLNATITPKGKEDAVDAIEGFVALLSGEWGYSLERIVEAVSNAHARLKGEQTIA